MTIAAVRRRSPSAHHIQAAATLAILHPKGGVGRSTTVWQLGAGLALRGRHVVIEDLDQGAHLSRTFSQYPLNLPGLQLASAMTVPLTGFDVVLVDTAPEAQRERAIEVLRRADWAIVPVKGPEASSVQASRCSCSGSPKRATRV